MLILKACHHHNANANNINTEWIQCLINIQIYNWDNTNSNAIQIPIGLAAGCEVVCRLYRFIAILLKIIHSNWLIVIYEFVIYHWKNNNRAWYKLIQFDIVSHTVSFLSWCCYFPNWLAWSVTAGELGSAIKSHDAVSISVTWRFVFSILIIRSLPSLPPSKWAKP